MRTWHNWPDAHYLPDRQEERPLAACENCGGELYRGERCYEIGGAYYCFGCVREAVVGDD